MRTVLRCLAHLVKGNGPSVVTGATGDGMDLGGNAATAPVVTAGVTVARGRDVHHGVRQPPLLLLMPLEDRPTVPRACNVYVLCVCVWIARIPTHFWWK